MTKSINTSSPDTKPVVRAVSASSLRTLLECSMKYYYGKILQLPQSQHVKTTMGSLVHSIFECLSRPRHKKDFDIITAGGKVDYSRSKGVIRLVKMWQDKYCLPQSLLDDLNDMLKVGLLDIDFFFSKAVNVSLPEDSFLIDLGDGVIIKGFIDRWADYGDKILIRDYKSQAQKKVVSDLQEDIQALIYQLFAWKVHGKLADVEFIMVRHAPTPRTPLKHIQRVEAATPDQLAGLEVYVKHIGGVMKNFSTEDAYSCPCTDMSTCQFRCSFYKPFEYKEIQNRATKEVIGAYFVDKCPQPKQDEVVIDKIHNGCSLRYRS